MGAHADDTDGPAVTGLAGYRLTVRKLIAGARVLIDNYVAELPSTGVVLLLGQNGAGKSLLLRAISQLDHGQEVELTAASGQPVPVAAVLDFPGLLGSDRLSDVMRKAAWFECDVDALGSYLSRLDVEVPERSPVSKWSLGNRQRVRIASALASQRKVMLMDEPFRSIDEAHLHSLVSLLAEEAKTRLIIVSTHRPELLAGLAKAAVVLSDNSSFQPPHMARPSGQIRVQLAKRAEASTVEIQTRTVSRSDLPEVLQTLALPESEVLSLLVQPDYSVGRDE